MGISIMEKELSKIGKVAEQKPQETGREPQCRNCVSYTKKDGRGWCAKKGKHVNRRGTCKRHTG